MSNLTTVDINLRNYITKIALLPMLEEQEEKDLLNKWCQHGCVESAQKLIASHLRLVVKIAQGFRFYGIPIMDLIQEGNFGLMTALKKFNEEKNCKFATYSILWIKARIQNFILNSWSLVKVNTTNSKRKLFFGLKKILKSLENSGEKDLSFFQKIDAISQKMQIPAADVKDIYNISTQNPVFLSDSYHSNAIDDHQEFGEMLLSEDNQERQIINQDLQHKKKTVFLESLEQLSAREKEILMQRNNNKKITLEELSNKFKISKERIRQIEKKALEKMQKFCKNKLPINNFA